MKKHLLTASLLLTASFTALSQQSVQPSDVLMKKITPLLTSQASTIRYFDAPADNIAIGIVTKDYQKRVYYTTPNGEYLMSGMMFDVDNKVSFNDQITDQLKVVLPDRFVKDLPNTKTITTGSGDNNIYAFVDINCPFCHKLHKQIKELQANGKLNNTKVHYVLIGIMKSEAQASTILAQEDLEEQYKLFDEAMQTRFVPKDDVASIDGRSALELNQTAFRNFPMVRGVPFVIGEINGDWKFANRVPKHSFYLPFNDVDSSAEEITAP